MQITYDPKKNTKNIQERDLSFDQLADLEWATAIGEDTRKDYGERRLQAFAMLDGRLYFTAFTRRNGATHVISFRKANGREVKRYEQQKKH